MKVSDKGKLVGEFTLDELWSLLCRYGGRVHMGLSDGVVFYISGFRPYVFQQGVARDGW